MSISLQLVVLNLIPVRRLRFHDIFLLFKNSGKQTEPETEELSFSRLCNVSHGRQIPIISYEAEDSTRKVQKSREWKWK